MNEGALCSPLSERNAAAPLSAKPARSLATGVFSSLSLTMGGVFHFAMATQLEVLMGVGRVAMAVVKIFSDV